MGGKSPRAVGLDGLGELLVARRNEGAVPSDRLLDALAGEEHRSNSIWPGQEADVTRDGLRMQAGHLPGQDPDAADGHLASVDVDEAVVHLDGHVLHVSVPRGELQVRHLHRLRRVEGPHSAPRLSRKQPDVTQWSLLTGFVKGGSSRVENGPEASQWITAIEMTSSRASKEDPK